MSRGDRGDRNDRDRGDHDSRDRNAGAASDTADRPAVSFDLFGTLVEVDRPDDPAAAVATELRERGVPVPDDWAAAYAEPHVSVDAGAELALDRHVAAAVADRSTGVDADEVRADCAAAVRAAFDAPVETREGAVAAVESLAEERPVGLLSNCSVPGLVDRALARSALDPAAVDAVVVSVDCGWRKPDPRAFEAVAAALGVPVDRLVHVGDDPETDGGVVDAGGRFVSVDDRSLTDLPALGGGPWA